MLTWIIALAVYDCVLSFPAELRGIWKQKFRTGATLYLLIRYGTILFMLFSTFTFILVPKTPVVSFAIQLTAFVFNLEIRGGYQ